MKETQVLIETNHGKIVIALDHENTPQTTENFLNYVKNHFYDQTIFHRVINNFMIQGGGFDTDMQQKKVLFSAIQNEAKNAKPNKKGTIAMARTSDPHSATAQFFINVKDNDFLNFTSESTQGYGYCVFGQVVEGMEIVEAIKSVSTSSQLGHDDVPVEPVVIQSMTLQTEITNA